MEPLVSILIPAFNAEQWLAEAIRSALAQTWPRKELIIVDDGSSDNTLQVARQFSAPAVAVVTQKNQGASAARNAALALAQGDYVQWLDADDLLAPDKIEKQLRQPDGWANPRFLWSASWGWFYYRPHKARFSPNALWNDLSPQEWLHRKLALNLWMAIETWLVSRELTEKAGPWDVNLLRDNDGEYFTRVLRASEGIRFVSDARAYVRRTEFGNVSNDYVVSEAKIESLFQSVCRSIHTLRSFGESEPTRLACLVFLQRFIAAYQPRGERILQQADALAQELGGAIPMSCRRPAAAERLLGSALGQRVRSVPARVKALIAINWDKMMFSLEKA